MTSSFVTKLAVTLALALTTAATVSFAQSRPQSCIPHYDASGAQEAPYCNRARSRRALLFVIRTNRSPVVV